MNNIQKLSTEIIAQRFNNLSYRTRQKNNELIILYHHCNSECRVCTKIAHCTASFSCSCPDVTMTVPPWHGEHSEDTGQVPSCASCHCITVPFVPPTFNKKTGVTAGNLHSRHIFVFCPQILLLITTSFILFLSLFLPYINPLNTKRRLLYLKTQFVPRSKHFSSRL